MPAVEDLKPRIIRPKPTEADIALWQESFRSVVIAGQAALKSAILINGGAAVALLAFIGNIWTKGTEQAAVDSLTLSVGLFAGGVLAAAIASGGTYLTQFLYGLHVPKWAKLAGVLNVVTILLVVVSYALFGWGAYESYSAFAEHLPVKSIPQTATGTPPLVIR